MNAIPGAYYGYNVTHLDEHCRWMTRAGRAPRTIKARRMELQYLEEFLGHDPVDATQDELEAWQDSMPLEHLRLKTATVRPYYGYLHHRGYRPDNPAALLVSPKRKRGVPHPIRFDVMRHAVHDAPTPRVRAFLIFAAYAGLRAKEIAYIDAGCFEPRPGGGVIIRLTRTKGEHERISALPAWAWEMIQPDLATEGPCFSRERGAGPVLPQHVSQVANRWLHRCGTPSTLHSLRHWAATSGVENEDVRVVQEFLGHADLKTTAIYTEIQPMRIARMVDSFRRLDELPA
ncbi:tyrosine-type recombinase/integrase [Mycobacterium sp. NPDC050853]|uniref:tyrosine-type recombinase/integrase n=1 Tax=Mycobacterium sp. NPDC050853 TaxID=3155160 RepID=UPI0033C548D5